MSRKFNSPYYPASSPRAVEDGIRAKRARGKIASTWWSTRFIEVLEAANVGGRFSRGRNYARRGQVISIEVDAGQVTAQVQGSRSRPYRVRIGLTAYGKGDWARIEERLAADAWFVAQLLSGQMPPDIEQVFGELGLALFPAVASDLTLDCSCPDWEVPCKHLAAVFYLLAERFDEDPFLILAWRGRDREDLLSRLGTLTDAAAEADEVTPLTELLDVFYVAETHPLPPKPAGVSPAIEETPPVSVVVRGKPLTEVLRPAYEAHVRR